MYVYFMSCCHGNFVCICFEFWHIYSAHTHAPCPMTIDYGYNFFLGGGVCTDCSALPEFHLPLSSRTIMRCDEANTQWTLSRSSRAACAITRTSLLMVVLIVLAYTSLAHAMPEKRRLELK